MDNRSFLGSLYTILCDSDRRKAFYDLCDLYTGSDDEQRHPPRILTFDEDYKAGDEFDRWPFYSDLPSDLPNEAPAKQRIRAALILYSIRSDGGYDYHDDHLKLTVVYFEVTWTQLCPGGIVLMLFPQQFQVSKARLLSWLAQLSACGGEAFGSPEKRDLARRFRAQMSELDQINRTIQESTKLSDIDSCDDKWEDFLKRYGDNKSFESIDQSRLKLQAIQKEGDTLQQIATSNSESIEARVEQYLEFIQNHPDSVLAFMYLGGDLQKSGRLEESLITYRQALQLETTPESQITYHPSTILAIGNVLQKMGKLDAAAAEYQKVLESKEFQHLHGSAYLALGDVLKLKGDLSKAHIAWKKATKRDETGLLRLEVAKRLME